MRIKKIGNVRVVTNACEDDLCVGSSFFRYTKSGGLESKKEVEIRKNNGVEKSKIIREIRRNVVRENRLKRQLLGIAPPPRVRKCNVSKLKRKVASITLISAARYKYLVTVSFPIGMSKQMGKQCVYDWLTLLRRRLNLKYYIGFSEYQKNGTIHFHFIFFHYKWIDFKKANAVMATIIDNKFSRYGGNWGRSSKEKYNGVHFDPVKARGVSAVDVAMRYITKYVTKCYDCSEFDIPICIISRAVSRSFTHECEDVLPIGSELIKREDFFLVYRCPIVSKDKLLGLVNAMLFKMYKKIDY